MADELEVTLEQPSEAERRIKQLSKEKGESIAAKEVAEKAKQESDEKLQVAERKSAFLEGFSDIVSENPAAKEFKAEMEEKVLGGMSIEDAKFVVLGRAGKLGQSTQTESPAGGSATTTVTQSAGNKSVKEMSADERRQALVEAEQKGDITWQ